MTILTDRLARFAEEFRDEDTIDVGFQHPDTGCPIRVEWELGQPVLARAFDPDDAPSPPSAARGTPGAG